MYILILVVILFFSIGMNCTKIYAAGASSVMEGAENFLKSGNQNVVQGRELHSASNFIFYILFAIAIATAVIIGMIIGIRFMVSGVEEKAKIKEELLPYFVGCVIVFGAFGIWGLTVTILSKL